MSSEQPYEAIGNQTIRCLRSFEELLKGESKLAKTSPTFESLQRTQRRFKDWCGSLAAHRYGRLSLDERLRDASRIRRLVLDCLDGVEETLRNVKIEVPAPQGNTMMDQPQSIESLALDALISSSMIQDPIKHADSMIDTLLRVTVAIRQPLSVDRYMNSQGVALKDYHLFAKVDGEYLADGKLANMQEKLRERFLSASLQRRKFLQYTQDHRNKLACGLDTAGASSSVGDAEFLDQDELDSKYEDSMVSYQAPSISMSAILGQESVDDVAESASESSSESSFSIASSTVSGLEKRFKVPSFPEEGENGLRTCPCCYLLLSLRNARSWEHIMADLRPYVCTFVECAHDPRKLYSRKSTWFEHELTFHRRRWECSLGCSKDLSSQAELKYHIHEKHPDIQDITLVQSLLTGREIAARSEAKCPFCSNVLKSRKHIRQHIANHQKQIALRALYSMRILPDESNGESDQESDRVSILSADSAQEVGKILVSSESFQAEEPQGFPDPNTKSTVMNSASSTQKTTEAMEIDTKMVEPQAETQGTAQRESSLTVQTDSRTRTSWSDLVMVKIEPGAMNREIPDTHKIKRPDKPALITRNPSKSLPGAVPRWILLLSRYHMNTDRTGLCLGQVLLHARDPGSFLLDSALPFPDNMKVYGNVKSNVVFSMSDSASRLMREWAAGISGATVETLRSRDLIIRFKSLEDRLFQPYLDYIQDVIKLEPLQKYLQQGSFTSSKRLFMVVGIRIANVLKLQGQPNNVEVLHTQRPEAEVSIPGDVVPDYAGFSGTRSTISHEIESRAVLAYSLMEIKRSWLGNVMIGPFEKGDMM